MISGTGLKTRPGTIAEPAPGRGILLLCAAVLAVAGGCTSGRTPRWVEQPWSTVDEGQVRSGSGNDGGSFTPQSSGNNPAEGQAVHMPSKAETDQAFAAPNHTAVQTSRVAVPQEETVIRGQDTAAGTPYWPPATQQGGSYIPPPGNTPGPGTQYNTYAPPQTDVAPPGTIPIPPNGVPGQVPPYFQTAPGAVVVDPYNYADIDVMLQEAQTGRMTFGAAYNSNSGLVGQFIIDERNFDIGAWPRSVEDIINGTAWRGAGQGFRLELVPGNEVQRYALSFDEPYLFNSAVSFSASGYFFDRRYFDWDEQRLGGRFALGYRLTPDLSISAGVRLENVNIHDPRVNTSPSLNAVLGDNALFLGTVSLVNDTRDHPFMASEGSYLELAYHQAFGDFDYPRGDVDYRRYFLIYQRPDGSGRHTLSLQSRLGFTGSATPVFENYFAGGFSTIRGFALRGASPVEGGVRVGGQFQWLNTAEYTFPITADDMFKGVLFCDFGTVEEEVRLSSDTFRVAPGFGFRIHMPVGGGGGAPLAFDFAFPISDADTDDHQVISFYMGILR